MRKLHKKPLIMAAATLALTGTLAVGSAMAYFTTYSTAGGGVKMNMGFTETVPKEDVDENGKHITIENTGDYDCFVRVTAFAPVKLTYNAPKGGWTDARRRARYFCRTGTAFKRAQRTETCASRNKSVE